MLQVAYSVIECKSALIFLLLLQKIKTLETNVYVLNFFLIHTFFLQLLASQHGNVSMTTMNTVADVLSKLLVVGITDLGMYA